MTDIGYAALALALLASLYAMAASIFGERGRRAELVRTAEMAVWVVAGLVTLASAALLFLLLNHDFGVRYVYEHTSSYLPTVYTLSAFWAGQAGSLLFWLWVLSLLSVAMLALKGDWNRDLMPYAVAVVAFTQAFFAFLLVTVSNPFERLPAAPAEGYGLNPLLQNFGMIVHPPVVFIGYAAYTIPFAFALAALMTGQLDRAWVRGLRRWNLFAWLFLGIGILIGAWWAYLELGWGGYWGWDPVENASLVPWLTGTAILHSVMMEERRGMFKVWNVALIAATFVLCILATFITRSGFIQSVHAFGESVLGYYFMGFIIFTLLVTAGLAYSRRERLASEHELDSLLSRESAFFFTNLLFSGAALIVLIGTFFLPIGTRLLAGREGTWNPETYNRMGNILGPALILLIGLCPVLGWRRTAAERLGRALLVPLAVAAVTAVALFLFGVREFYPLLGFAVCGLVATSVVAEFYRGVVARHRSTGENYGLALLRLVGKGRRRYGGYVVHLSIVLIAIGIIGSSFSTEVQVALAEGEKVDVKGYELVYRGVASEATQEKQRFAATVDIYRDGQKLATVVPEKNYHWNIDQWVSEVALRTNLVEDLYVILAGVEDSGVATFQVFVNPLVMWLWIGGGVLLLGAAIAFWPEAIPVRRREVARRGVTYAGAEALEWELDEALGRLAEAGEAAEAEPVAGAEVAAPVVADDVEDEIEREVQALRQARRARRKGRRRKAAAQPAGGFCPKCGTQYDPGDRFCVKCGQKL